MDKKEFEKLVDLFSSGSICYFNLETQKDYARLLRNEVNYEIKLLAMDLLNDLKRQDKIYEKLKIWEKKNLEDEVERNVFFIGFSEGAIKKKETLIYTVKESSVGTIEVNLFLRSNDLIEAVKNASNKRKARVSIA